MAESLGQRAGSVPQRRALANCGTKQISAKEGVSVKTNFVVEDEANISHASSPSSVTSRAQRFTRSSETPSFLRRRCNTRKFWTGWMSQAMA